MRPAGHACTDRLRPLKSARSRLAGRGCGRQSFAVNEVLPQLHELLFPQSSRVGGIVRGDRDGRPGRGPYDRRTGGLSGVRVLVGANHGSYLRFFGDLPTAGRFVVVSLRVRRFVCEEGSCERMSFVEQLPGLTRRFGRRTERLRSTLVSVGLALAGRAGAQMTDAFKVPVSRNTLLRLIASLPDPATAVPRVVGVDEYAQRKGRERPSLRSFAQHLERPRRRHRGPHTALELRRRGGSWPGLGWLARAGCRGGPPAKASRKTQARHRQARTQAKALGDAGGDAGGPLK
ncbi:hypothetical protein SAMN06272775_0150 [Streptomyces sp. 2323.1]|nr:hypothetical protein SAMN06272775_0150 [Streptomyces sp. 2323.1]